MRTEFVINKVWHRMSYCVHCNKTLWYREGSFRKRFVLRFDIQPWNVCDDCNTAGSIPWKL